MCNRKHKITSLITALIMVAVISIPSTISVTAIENTSVEINNENFPDDSFREYIAQNFDIDRDGILSQSEIMEVKELDIYEKGISDLRGISYFDSLEMLICGGNGLKELPQLPDSLDALYCYYNNLTELPNLPESLTVLDCASNNLTSLPELPSGLQALRCESNNLTSLPEIPDSVVEFKVANNKLKKLPGLPESAWFITCNNNELTDLPEIPKNTFALWCFDNQLQGTLDVSKCNKLKELLCYNNKITNIKLSKTAKYSTINVSRNNIGKIDKIIGQTISWDGTDYKFYPQNNIPYAYTLKKISAPNIKKKSKYYITVSWTNISGETGYQVARSTKKSSGYKVIKTVSKKYRTTTIKTTRNKTYYYKVRAYKSIGGQRICAPWSSPKKYILK